jgi:hypothetical protein
MFTFLFGITVTINIITKIKWRPKLNYRDMQAQNIMHAIQSEAGYNFLSYQAKMADRLIHRTICKV